MTETLPTSETASAPLATRSEFRKLDVNVRETDYVAGKDNLTAIVIRNTYPVSIRLLSVTASHSSLNTASKSTVYAGYIRHPRPSSTRFRFSIPVPLLFGRSDRPLFELSRVSTNTVETEPLNINAEAGAILNIDERTPVDREVNINAASGAIINFERPTRFEEDAEKPQITPMSEIVSEYLWRTKSWLIFIPSRIGIDIEIKYEIDTEVRSQVVSTVFDIKPPVSSILIGGIAGGIIGNLARAFLEPGGFAISVAFFVKLIASCLLSIMAVIFLSRKSGPQAFITVEDFFGAFVLGSLIGYEGPSFFEKTVINGVGSAPSNLTHPSSTPQ